MSTPTFSAARKDSIVFCGASAAAPRWPTRSTGLSLLRIRLHDGVPDQPLGALRVAPVERVGAGGDDAAVAVGLVGHHGRLGVAPVVRREARPVPVGALLLGIGDYDLP